MIGSAQRELEIATSAARRAGCQKDYDSFRDAVERAVVLNPMDGNSVAYLGELLIYAGKLVPMNIVLAAKDSRTQMGVVMGTPA